MGSPQGVSSVTANVIKRNALKRDSGICFQKSIKIFFLVLLGLISSEVIHDQMCSRKFDSHQDDEKQIYTDEQNCDCFQQQEKGDSSVPYLGVMCPAHVFYGPHCQAGKQTSDM